MEHVLDNPAWNALISGNKHLSYGNEQAKFFDKAVSPFAALDKNTEAGFLRLHQLVEPGRTILFVTITESGFPPCWSVKGSIKGWQMVYEGSIAPEALGTGIAKLRDEHIPQMLELTELTNPGPFATRTIDFGNYYGMFRNDKLVAMTGQRLQPFNYTEISAVCTHPDHLGKGYAGDLLRHRLKLILAAGSIPFLHVRHDNDRAIKVYKRIGFSTRKAVYFYVLESKA